MPNIFFPASKADSSSDRTDPADEREKTVCALAALVHLSTADLDATILESAATHIESATASLGSVCTDVKNWVGALQYIENKDRQAGEALLRNVFPPGNQPESHQLRNIKNAVDSLLKSPSVLPNNKIGPS
ncbi:hypothetical protein PG985_005762 [Apiospora marii]|uniref:uncharacterized protein n=1 Tax=Apiospora marii TaxID=335849 RepID=UPI00312E6513